MIEVRSPEEPVGQVRYGSLDHLEHGLFGNFGATRRDKIIILCFDLEEVTEGRLETDVVKGGHFFAI